MYRQVASLALAGLLAPALASADDIASAAQDLCEKVRSCAMAQVAEEDMTPELRQMMEPMLDNMCANMQSKVQEVNTGHPLYQPSIACMRSMAALSCEEMQDQAGMQTSECEAYEELARKYADQN